MQKVLGQNAIYFYKHGERNERWAVRLNTSSCGDIAFSLPSYPGLSRRYIDQIISTGFILDLDEKAIKDSSSVNALSRLINSAHFCSTHLNINLALSFNPMLMQLVK